MKRYKITCLKYFIEKHLTSIGNYIITKTSTGLQNDTIMSTRPISRTTIYILSGCFVSTFLYIKYQL